MGTSVGFSDAVEQYAPWRKGVAWWVVLLQGLIILGVGAYAFWVPGQASRVIVYGIGAYLVLAAITTVVAAMRGRDAGLSVFGLMAAGGGLVAGISVLLPFLRNIEDEIAKTTMVMTAFGSFGVALILIGILTMAAAFVERPEGGVVWLKAVRGLVWVALGGYVVYAILGGITEPNMVKWIAVGLMVIGALLALYSFLLYRQQSAPQGAAAAASSGSANNNAA